jgi:hypothetical protein
MHTTWINGLVDTHGRYVKTPMEARRYVRARDLTQARYAPWQPQQALETVSFRCPFMQRCWRNLCAASWKVAWLLQHKEFDLR